MENKTFVIKNGKITFDSDRILISDNCKKEKRNLIISSTIWALFGVLSLIRYLKTGEPFLLWTGLIIGVGHIIKLILILNRTTQNELLNAEIININFYKWIGNKFMSVKLNNNRVRRVNYIENTFENLKEYALKRYPTK